MNRYDLQEISLIRLNESKILLDNESYEGAYYLCGYVVECSLKACIAKQTKQYDFPDRQIINESYTHNLTRLVKAANLVTELDKKIMSDVDFAVNWNIVIEWSEESRYRKSGKIEAFNLYSAISDKEHGVLKWIKQHW